MVFQVVDTCHKEFIVSIFKTEKYKTDTSVFRLHYKLSVWLVILYSICYTYVQLAAPISCMSSKDNKEFVKVLEDFCWVHGTYSILNANTSGGRKEMYAGFGVGSVVKSDELGYHQYYKWMYFYIMAMVILLLSPRQAWRFIEGGRMAKYVENLDWKVLVRNEDVKKKEKTIVDFLYYHLGYHGKYAYGFVMCEVMNVVVSSTLLYVWDLISSYQLSANGLAGFKYVTQAPVTRTDTLAKVFPLMAKCTFNNYGPSGSIETHDVMCVLPLNVINERAAVFFWVYFIIVISLGVAQLVFRIMLIFCKRVRTVILVGASPLTPADDINTLINRCSYSDWFILNQISYSLDPLIYKEVLTKLAERIGTKSEVFHRV